MPELDPNAIASAVIENLVKDLAKSVIGGSSIKLKDIYNKYFDNFDSVLKSTYQNISCVRTLTQRDRSTKLTEIYVPLSFLCSGETESDESVLSRLSIGEKTIVQATGGAGKSVFLKYAWLRFFEKPVGKIPIFVELRVNTH